MSSLRIVDVGAPALDFEDDVYAPLRDVAPVETIGFDCFASPSTAPDGVTEVHRRDGRVVRTYPCLIADGGKVTFHINRFDATSSIFPANHTLTRPFGLLNLAVETVTTQELPSRRLDDILPDDVAIDLLKIDVQGATHVVLDNAHAVLRRTLVCHVEAEFAPVYLGERCSPILILYCATRAFLWISSALAASAMRISMNLPHELSIVAERCGQTVSIYAAGLAGRIDFGRAVSSGRYCAYLLQ